MHAFIEKCKNDEEEVLCLRRGNYKFLEGVNINPNAIKELALNAFDSNDRDTVMIIEQYYVYDDLFKVLFTTENKIHNYIPSVKWKNYITRMHTLVKKEVSDIKKIVENELRQYSVIINRNNKAIQIRSAISSVVACNYIITKGKKSFIEDIECGGLCSNSKWACKPNTLFIQKLNFVYILNQIKNLTFKNKISTIMFWLNKRTLISEEMSLLLSYFKMQSVKQLIFKYLIVNWSEYNNIHKYACTVILNDCQWIWIIGSKAFTIKLKSKYNIMSVKIINHKSIYKDNCIIAKVNKLYFVDINISILPNEKDKTKKLIKKLYRKDDIINEMYIVFNTKDINNIRLPINDLRDNSSQFHMLQNVWVPLEVRSNDFIHFYRTLKSLPKFHLLEINVKDEFKEILERKSFGEFDQNSNIYF